MNIISKKLQKKDYLIMGILNITPDSFFDGGKYLNPNSSLEQVDKMVVEGVDILDIGGESTRPNSNFITLEEELARVIPIIKIIKKKYPNLTLSIDTTKSIVMQEAIEEGVEIINDISGLTFDERSVEIVSFYQTPVVVMHSPWKPKTMQQDYNYNQPILDHIEKYFEERIETLIKNGIQRDNIIIDPGIGFGKSIDHNFNIISNINRLVKFKLPILLGGSNKSYIGKYLNLPIDKRGEGNSLSEALAFKQGVKIFRVHNVASTKRTLELMKKFINSGFK